MFSLVSLCANVRFSRLPLRFLAFVVLLLVDVCSVFFSSIYSNVLALTLFQYSSFQCFFFCVFVHFMLVADVLFFFISFCMSMRICMYVLTDRDGDKACVDISMWFRFIFLFSFRAGAINEHRIWQLQCEYTCIFVQFNIVCQTMQMRTQNTILSKLEYFGLVCRIVKSENEQKQEKKIVYSMLADVLLLILYFYFNC